MITLNSSQIFKWLSDDVMYDTERTSKRIINLVIAKCERDANEQLKSMMRKYPDLFIE